MTLDLDVSELRMKGRATKPLHTAQVRELVEEDLPKLEIEKGVKPPPLAKISQRHHQLAKEVASGKTLVECAVLTGYSGGRISILLSDDAFIELVTYYQSKVEETFIDRHQMLSDLAIDATRTLHRRLDDEPDDFSIGQLMDIVVKTSDRTGHGPATTSTNINIGVNMADRLQAARERVNRSKEVKTIEGTVKDVTEKTGTTG